MTREFTVHIVDDDQDLRTAIQELFRESGYQTIGYASAEEFLTTSLKSGVNCLILDIRMSGMSGMQMLDELNRRGLPIPVIFLTGHGSVPTAIKAIRNGAFEFLEKPIDSQILLDKVEMALQTSADRQEQLEILDTMTNREVEIMHLLAKGNSNKTISVMLGLSTSTVNFHRMNIKRKTNANSVSDFVRLSNAAPPPAIEKVVKYLQLSYLWHLSHGGRTPTGPPSPRCRIPAGP